MTKTSPTAETFSLKTVIRRKWRQLQRPGNHWFFLLYLAGLLVLLVIASLLKFGIKLL